MSNNEADRLAQKLTAERLRGLVHYSPETGLFVWKVKMSARYPGDRVGMGLDGCGYLKVQIDGVSYRLHRLAWLYMTGEWPACLIDHINGSRADNRFANLRAADRSINSQNSLPRRNSSSGYQGVSRASASTWAAKIRHNGKQIYLGCFPTAEAAHSRYMEQKALLHPGYVFRETSNVNGN